MLERLTPCSACLRENKGHTVAALTRTDAPVPTSPAVGPDSWTELLHQEIPLHPQLSALPVQRGDQGNVIPGLLLLTVAEDVGGAFCECFLPDSNLPGMDFIPRGQLGHRLLTLHSLRGHLDLESRSVLPRSLPHILLVPGRNNCPRFKSGTFAKLHVLVSGSTRDTLLLHENTM